MHRRGACGVGGGRLRLHTVSRIDGRSPRRLGAYKAIATYIDRKTWLTYLRSRLRQRPRRALPRKGEFSAHQTTRTRRAVGRTREPAYGDSAHLERARRYEEWMRECRCACSAAISRGRRRASIVQDERADAQHA